MEVSPTATVYTPIKDRRAVLEKLGAIGPNPTHQQMFEVITDVVASMRTGPHKAIAGTIILDEENDFTVCAGKRSMDWPHPLVVTSAKYQKDEQGRPIYPMTRFQEYRTAPGGPVSGWVFNSHSELWLPIPPVPKVPGF